MADITDGTDYKTEQADPNRAAVDEILAKVAKYHHGEAVSYTHLRAHET